MESFIRQINEVWAIGGGAPHQAKTREQYGGGFGDIPPFCKDMGKNGFGKKLYAYLK
jgi:hypothetical protein